MPTIENNKPSQSAKTEGNDQEGDGVIQGTTTAVTNLPSGLDVLANAAANEDDVQVLPIEIIVIDDVPEVCPVSVSSLDASVYSFLGPKELYAPFKETINEMLSAKEKNSREREQTEEASQDVQQEF